MNYSMLSLRKIFCLLSMTADWIILWIGATEYLLRTDSYIYIPKISNAFDADVNR